MKTRNTKNTFTSENQKSRGVKSFDILHSLRVTLSFALFGVLFLSAANLNVSGQSADSFNPNATYNGTSIYAPVHTIVRQPDGKILIGGIFTSLGGQSFNKIARLNPDGTRDTTFNSPFATNGSEVVLSIALQPDGKILIGGNFIAPAPGNVTGIKRLNSDGSFDTSFVYVPVATVKAILVLSDGNIFIGSDFNNTGAPTNRPFITKLFSNGELDLSFNPRGDMFANNTSGGGIAGGVHQIIQQPDGKIIIGGWFNFFNPSGTINLNGIARINTNGTFDTSFNARLPRGGLFAMVQQPNGKILIGGSGLDGVINSSSLIIRKNIARLSADGLVDTSFDAMFAEVANNAAVIAIALQADGKILVGGQFVNIGGQPRNGFARLNPNGNADDFISGNGQPYSIVVQPDGKILVGGGFTIMGGQPRNNIARLNPNDTNFDFDGDGKADVSVFRPSNGAWYLNQSSAGFTGVTFGQNGDLIAPADYDGDGKTDVAVFRPSNGAWYYLRSSDGAFVGLIFGQNGDLPRPADFDGDGKADINVFRPSNGAWYRLNSSDGSFFGTIFGQNGDQPLIADFDGDAKSDIAVFRLSSGTFYWLNSSTGGFRASAFGLGTDIPTMGDFDGDGKTDIAVFRPSNGVWYRYNSSNGAFVGVSFGSNGDIPVTADYDGDGKADFAVFRPSNGAWYYMNSSNGGFVGQVFGFGTDKPIPSAFVQ